MKFTLLVAALLGTAVVVRAGGYGQGKAASSGYGNCGHDCSSGYQAEGQLQSGARNAYGPYHSYPVRPAVYGGQGLYSYRGYARHYPAPAANHRPTRSHKVGPYTVRPVNVLMLVPTGPVYGRTSRPAYRPARPQATRGHARGPYQPAGHRGYRAPRPSYNAYRAAPSTGYRSSARLNQGYSQRGQHNANGGSSSRGYAKASGGY